MGWLFAKGTSAVQVIIVSITIKEFQNVIISDDPHANKNKAAYRHVCTSLFEMTVTNVFEIDFVATTKCRTNIFLNI